MVTPPKGDYASVPLNADGTKAADAWDPAKDIAAGEQCRAFGAAGIMRLPVRLHITWQDDTTLKMDIDNGNQVRLFHFVRLRRLRRRTPSWQGLSARRLGNGPAGPGPRASRRRTRQRGRCPHGAQRVAQSGHDEDEARLPPPKRRAVQRQRRAHRVLRSHQRTKRRLVADSDVHRGRPGLSEPAVHADHALQARAGRIEVQAGVHAKPRHLSSGGSR